MVDQDRLGTRRSLRNPLDPLRPLSHARALLIVSGVVLVLVIVVGLVVAHAAEWDSRELAVLQWLSAHHTASLSAIALGIAWLFSPPIAAAITVLVGIAVLAVTRSPTRLLTFWAMVGVSYLGSEVVKQIVRRVRPDSSGFANPLANEHSFSFPSGHTSFAAALAIAIIFLARDHYVRRIVAVCLVSVAVLIVAWSRVYLGVHYPTDVVAAIIYAAASSVLVLLLWLGVVMPRLRSSLEGRRRRGTS
ncbi:MAG: phosphatase PAP2 family protein [Lacisediminihabitans sp.]